MTGPSRGTIAGRAYLALRQQARVQGRNTSELLQLHALESFVDRLSTSPRAEDLVLKGGVLLAAYDIRRPTRDVDLAAQRTTNDPESVRQLVATVLSQPREDGWLYDGLSASTIRDEDQYAGVRVKVACKLESARVTFHVDVNVGDVLWPSAVGILLPRLLGGTIAVRGYPLAMVLAEKLVTALQRGVANTRWRDFADLYLLSGKHGMDGAELYETVHRVAAQRAADLRPLTIALRGFGPPSRTKWSAWVRKQQLSSQLPDEFQQVLDQVQAFSDPVLTREVSQHAWDPQACRWTET